jgi:rRNA maturation RNase YbeY
MINFNYERIQFRERRCHCKLAFCVNFVEGEEREKSLYLCDDEYLHKINLEYLKHDDLTDNQFWLYVRKRNSWWHFISVERVQENAADFKVPFEEEIRRVMVHGVCISGYKDKEKRKSYWCALKRMKNWCSTWNSKSYLCLSAAMFHVERLLRML